VVFLYKGFGKIVYKQICVTGLLLRCDNNFAGCSDIQTIVHNNEHA